jgi:hypothetical protein
MPPESDAETCRRARNELAKLRDNGSFASAEIMAMVNRAFSQVIA